MGLLDNLLRNTQQSGDFSKSLVDALNTMLSDGGQAQSSQRSPGAASQSSGRQQEAESQQDGNFVGGLSEMIEKLQKAGCGDAVKSWIGKGENAPIGPEPIKKALGTGTVKDLANESGLPENELLTQLSKMLPGLIDRLTPNGRMPQSWQEVVASLQQQQQPPPRQQR
jgi:uncharacterized protein YidB (DUF937 family)